LVLSHLEDATIAVRTWWLAFAVLTAASSRAAMAGAQQTCRVSVQPIAVAVLQEASGIALSRKTPGLLWLHNDSGEPMLVAVGADGVTRGRIRVSGASVEDWEDIDVGPCSHGSCVYIGDIGDNGANRRNIEIFRVAEPDVDAAASSAAESMRLTYPDGARDAESLIVMPDGSIFIVSKGERGPIAIYRVPGGFRSGAAVELERVATLAEAPGGERSVPRNQRITGGAASPDGRWIALRTLYSVTFYSASDFVRGDVHEVMRFDVSGIRERQGEGIAVGEGGAVWLASEGGGGNRPGTIARVDCPLK
jgi:hypothetical protein